MKLVASMLVGEVELDRYLVPCVESLLEFCDEVALMPDATASSRARGGWVSSLVGQWGEGGRRVVSVTPPAAAVSFFDHEGQARQRLLDFTLSREPSHVLAIDADEFVEDGRSVRAACLEAAPDAWGLCMREVWNVDAGELDVRQDGGWREHEVACLWRVERLAVQGPLVMADSALACGRTPVSVRRAMTGSTCTGLLHFGWACRADRQARYDRYVKHDGGRFHASDHLSSIMWPDDRVTVEAMSWPTGLADVKDRLVARATRP